MIFSRLVLCLLSSYTFTWGVTALGTVLLVMLGIEFHNAETAMLLVAIPLLLYTFLKSFCHPQQRDIQLILIGGSVAMTAAAWVLQKNLLT